MAYNANTDYLALIDKANATGDYASAAKYEAQRNEKLSAMNAAGTNTNGYTMTNNYGAVTQEKSYSGAAQRQGNSDASQFGNYSPTGLALENAYLGG